jgi:hypothetical protein
MAVCGERVQLDQPGPARSRDCRWVGAVELVSAACRAPPMSATQVGEPTSALEADVRQRQGGQAAAAGRSALVETPSCGPPP